MRPYAPASPLVEFYDHTPVYSRRPDVPFYVEEARTSGGDVLELGCGTGRVLLPTARAIAALPAPPDRRVVGLDLSEGMLARCKVKLAAEPAGVRDRVRLVRATMTAFDLDQHFALVTAPFRGFQHLLAVEEQLACLAQVRRHLAPDGRFVFDVFHPDPRRLADSSAAVEQEDVPEFELPDGRRYRRAARVAASHRARQVNDVELVSYVTHPGGRVERLVDAFPMRYYFPFELEHLLARAGLDVVAIYGDFDRTPLGDDSPELIVVAHAKRSARAMRTERPRGDHAAPADTGAEGGAQDRAGRDSGPRAVGPWIGDEPDGLAGAGAARPEPAPPPRKARRARGAPPEQHDAPDSADERHQSTAARPETLPRGWSTAGRRVIAVDWSGAYEVREQRARIWVAEAQGGRLMHLESGRDRAGVVELLLREKARDPTFIVGLDFAFSFPAWYLEQHGLGSAPELWERVDRDGAQWLAACEWPFWGKPGQGRPNLPKHLRQTEAKVHRTSGFLPKSVFQISGAGSVGAGSLRGMPVLRRLRDAGFSVWPFDPPGWPRVVEIYPRVLTGRVNKSNVEQRTAYLRDRWPSLHATAPALHALATSSDDAFDAAVSALVMDAHADDLAALARPGDAAAQSGQSAPEATLEGEIWVP